MYSPHFPFKYRFYIYFYPLPGFYVEFTHEEGLAFIDKRIKLLEDKGKELTYETTKLKANIKLVLQGLREMQNIPEESLDKSKNRDPLFG